jgi:LysM repeat protein
MSYRPTAPPRVPQLTDWVDWVIPGHGSPFLDPQTADSASLFLREVGGIIEGAMLAQPHGAPHQSLLRFAALVSLMALLSCEDSPQPSVRAVVPTEIVVSLPIATARPTSTPAPVTPRPTVTPLPTPTPRFHTVAAGDVLWVLAQEYGVTVSAIQEANAILEPSRIQIGQELVIPEPDPSHEQGIPTPTPLVYAIRGVTFHRTPSGSLWCLGEVWNTSGTLLEEVRVRVTLQDKIGRSLASGEGMPSLDVIGPDQRAPFALMFRDPPQEFAQYQAQSLRGKAALHGSTHYTDLEVVEDRGQMEGQHFVVEGQIHNSGAAVATTRLALTAYDARGDVIGLRSHSLPDPLEPGAMSPFAISLLPINDPVSSYAIQMQGAEVVSGE